MYGQMNWVKMDEIGLSYAEFSLVQAAQRIVDRARLARIRKLGENLDCLRKETRRRDTENTIRGLAYMGLLQGFSLTEESSRLLEGDDFAEQIRAFRKQAEDREVEIERLRSENRRLKARVKR